MTGGRRSSGRGAALGAALDAVPPATSDAPIAVLPVAGTQWHRSVADAELDALFEVYAARRVDVISASDGSGAAIARRLRPATLELASAAQELCDRLETLSALDAGDEPPRVARTCRDHVVQDARAVVTAVMDDVDPPPNPSWPSLLVAATADDRDVLLALFGIRADELTDDTGSFCDARVLAHYRLRLPELQSACDPVLGLVAKHPPSVFTAVSAARDLATSVSPYVTLRSAREIRTRILEAFGADPARALAVVSDAAREMDKEWSSFVRLRDRLRRAESAETERDRAVSVLEAYKHMSEGITRRWVWVLLRLTGLDGSPPTVGMLGEPAAARLGALGGRIEAALVPAMRNAEAHEDFEFDEDTGLLVVGDATFEPDEILARLTDLDILQRALIVGRLAAFADEPALAGDTLSAPFGVSASSAMTFARQRFGHAGQRVRSFVRDRDRLDIVIDALRPEACNPCFVALSQVAWTLPTVSRFVVCVSDREDPVIDLPADVLHANWPVFEASAGLFHDALPQVTFLPCHTWIRLSCEPVDEAARVGAWLALNDAQHAILDAEAAPRDLVRLPQRLRLVAAAATATLRLLPQGPHLEPLLRAERLARATAKALSEGGPHGITAGMLMDGILRTRDRLGGPPAILPTLDPSPLPARAGGHDTS
jgi:hypothetical protein